MQSWFDFKGKTKDKLKEIRQHRNKTGGGPPCNIVLTDFEERLISIVGLSSLDGDSDLNEIGLGNSNDSK